MFGFKYGVRILVFLAVTSFSFAQDSTTVSDYESWVNASVEKSFLKKKLKLGLTQEFRFDDNSMRLDNFFTELEGSYSFYKGFSIGLAYRYIRNQKKSGDINEQRINADLSYKHKLDRFRLGYRFRFQRRDQLGFKKSEGDHAILKYRIRLKVDYNIRNWKLDPYISMEAYIAQETNTINYIESITETERVSGFEKFRFTLGTQYKIAKFLEIGGFYRIEREFKSYQLFYNTPATYYIGGLKLMFKL